MKIVLIRDRDNRKIRSYQHPQNVIVKPKEGTVEIRSSDGNIIEKYDLIEKDLEWIECENSDCTEILTTLKVGKVHHRAD